VDMEAAKVATPLFVVVRACVDKVCLVSDNQQASSRGLSCA
jgi:hypothetical protein